MPYFSVLTFFLVFSLFPTAQAQDLTGNIVGGAPKIVTQDDPYENVPDAFIEEAIYAQEECEADERISNHYDCKCRAIKLLNARIKAGEKARYKSLLLSIKDQCLDGTGLAGEQYNKCIADFRMYVDVPKNVSKEKFCYCIGNQYAKGYELYGKAPSVNTFFMLNQYAKQQCTRTR